MKTEITLENKAKFFAQYWGQPVFRQPYFLENEQNDIVEAYCLNSAKGFIYLKNPSSITDEDAVDMAMLNRDLGDNKDREEIIRHSKKNIQYDTVIGSLRPHHIDFLRLRGYAVDWLELSVQNMVEAGWIKLIES